MPNASRYRIVAVSGGVDSVVLLHKMIQADPRGIVVAHVDHGIRSDSALDAAFVERLACDYGVTFRSVALQLGKDTSEEAARLARYDFLHRLAREYHQAPIYTAHHADDVVETIAINVSRGTGWRGLAVLSAPGVRRPQTTLFKDELISYARKHQLQWREDSTNQTDRYLRNRLRRKLMSIDRQTKLELLALWRRQQELATMINEESTQWATDQRYFYIMCASYVGEELLRSWLANQGIKVTRPQVKRLLLGIKTARQGTQLDIAAGYSLLINTQTIHITTNQ